jgi:hypothetical protein
MTTLAQLVAAVALGVGAIFGLNGDNQDHWSDPPNIVLSIDDDEQAGSGEPDDRPAP